MDASEVLKQVRKIEIKTKGLSKHIFSGEYHSAFKGRGMSFSEVREYSYGDDVRNIDWNVTARSGDAYIKVFEEERELTVMLLIDISGSAFFGTEEKFKNELITEISAVMAFSALNNNDKVGAILFSDQVEKYIPPSKGKKNILRIIRELIYFQPESKGTDVKVALEYLNNVQKKRSIVFIMSDFKTGAFDKGLLIASRRHDVVGMHFYDEKEKNMPNVGLLRVRDNETGELTTIDTGSSKVRTAIRESFLSHRNQFVETFRKTGSDTIDIKTDENYITTLLQFFKKRAK